MNCTTYTNNGPSGSIKEISGTTCAGIEGYYYINFGQSICMDNTKPIINLGGLIIGEECFALTPTPTPTNLNYCYSSGLTYYTVSYECPNDGNNYDDIYGVISVEIYEDGNNPTTNHPTYNFSVSNGIETELLSIPRGQSFATFIFPKVNFDYTSTGCTTTTLNDWYISNTAGLTKCLFITPTPTPTVTQTQTPTQTPTPTSTSPNYCPEQMYVENTVFSGASAPFLTGATGLYTRTYSYSGGSFNYGYYDFPDFVVGPDLSGKTAAVYQRYNATENTYWQSMAVVIAGPPYPVITRWSVFRTTGNYFINGGTLVPTEILQWTTNLTTTNGITYPTKGYGSLRGYFSYPTNCPTATPTPTVTNTQTQTPTSTNPCPSCNQFYFSAGTRTGGNSPTGWTGTYELLKNVYYTQFNDQNSSPPSFSGECSSYEGISYTLWKNENDYGIGLFKTNNTGSTLNQYYYSGFTLLYPELMSRINYGQCGITFSYSGASGFAANLLTGNTCNGFVYPKDGINTSSIYVGQFLNKQDLEYSITYLNPCITPTPTRTLTPTPSVTQTITPSPS